MKYMSKKSGEKARIISPREAGSSPEFICRAVASDFKLRGITHLDAAKMLGVEKRTVSNQISGKRPFGKKSAQQYARVFGYEEPYLLYGLGSLKKEQPSQLPSDGIAALTDRITLLEQMVAKQNEQIARLKMRNSIKKSIIKSVRTRNATIEALDSAKIMALNLNKKGY